MRAATTRCQLARSGNRADVLVVGVEQDADPLAHRGAGPPVRLRATSRASAAGGLGPDPPDERGGAPDRVEPDEGLGLAVDEQQAALLEAAEGDGGRGT